MQEIELDVIRASLFDARPLSKGRAARLTVTSGPYAGDYEARLDGADRRYLYLLAHDRRGEPVVLPAGTPVTVSTGDRGGRCEFSSVTASLHDGLEQEDPLVTILLPIEAQRMQRRRYMRVEMAMPIRVAQLPGPEQAVDTVPRLATGETTNVAGGGLSFRCDELTLIPGDLVALTLALPPHRHVTATAEIVRIDLAGAYAAEFCDIDEKAQADLCAFAQEYRRKRHAAGQAPSQPPIALASRRETRQ